LNNSLRTGIPRLTIIAAAACLLLIFGCKPVAITEIAAQGTVPAKPPIQDWPQLGRDAQHTNYSPQQVDPPFCYAWKWYGAPIASRAQPVVANGVLFVGTLDGTILARNATTGAALWSANVGSPIRNAVAATAETVFTGAFRGETVALDATSGAQKWSTDTGSSATAPLLDAASNRLYVASTTGVLTALDAANGAILWQADLGAPILATPALSADGAALYLGVEAAEAVAVRAVDGGVLWRTKLQGQSLAERYPVVAGAQVIFRSQPLDHFHPLLHQGDDVLDKAGAVNRTDWQADWSAVRPQILTYLADNPDKQTFFVLDAVSGALLPPSPVLYTYGNNDIPAPPVIKENTAYLAYRARNGIQTNSPNAVHVTTRYDGELGMMNLASRDLTALRTSDYPASKFNYEFRLTSDEPAMLTMGGNLLLVDNWERLGGIQLGSPSQGELVYAGHVSSDWPECAVQCGPGGANPFFPMSGQASERAYPFPSPRVNEGHARSGAIIANNMIYWRVIEGGLAAIAHRSGAACPPPLVYREGETLAAVAGEQAPATQRPLADYVTLDLTTPAAQPPADLVERLRSEVRALVSSGDHLLPFYLERGFSNPQLWPYNTPNPPGPPQAGYGSEGNIYWHDPGELLYTLAAAYPYLDATLQISVTTYVEQAIARHPPLAPLPYGGLTWLRQGTPRELYAVPFRAELNSWPPPGVNLSVLYGLWLWSKNTGDWRYARTHWAEAKQLFEQASPAIRYYADIAGVIGFARLAAEIDGTESATYQQALTAAIRAMNEGLALELFRTRAVAEYPDPREQTTGWYLPVFFGMTPEVGLYLREQVEGAAELVWERESGNGLRWWYMTRAGAHAEIGETSYTAPNAAWSYFLAHAYLLGDSQQILRSYLDRPWAKGDLFSLQKLVATISALPFEPAEFVYLPGVVKNH
jgi:hypothetical protein